MSFDRYGSNVLAEDPHPPRRPQTTDTPAEPGLVVEDVQTGWVGAIVRVEKSGGVHVVVLEDRHGKTRTFPLGAGFWVDGKPVRLVPHRPAQQTPARSRTASGSVAVAGAKARVARGSRIWVEGRHDAELVEKVWGDDLRIEGVVVELLEGIDNLADHLAQFRPGPGRRVGVLADHLVRGSKESRIAAAATAKFGAEHVLVVGHPYVDVWQAVKPARVGLEAWPHIPRGTDIKVGSLRALGWPATDQADIARGWKRILSQVRDFRDLEPSLLGRVEELVDFVTAEQP
ncbi:DUF3097 domain-containing protein [Ruania zhangjianzhongii]|uniref:DUF3097 domain-containing protein n=1 Tax=Ruania zhangjianzhongii TaxID=2603206 RepID=UPI0011C953CD|nr:DUF3097 domain-containing protein [Ruania zhangjianzhongii]